MRNNEFKTYHPIVNFAYFVCVIGFSMFFMHPVCLFVSLSCAFACSVLLSGREAIKKNLLYMLPLMLFTALLNPLFSHEGGTVLMYLPSGNPLTGESAIYGFAASVMLVSVICWFSCCNSVMTSDKLIYLFGKILPSLSLILSMTFRFVPRFIKQMHEVSDAQRCIGRDMSEGNVIQRAKNGLSILSVMVTRAFENSIETADSMKARGYGASGRTSFSVFKFDKRDGKTFFCILFLGVYILTAAVQGEINFVYFPYISGADWSFYTLSAFAAYALLCALPLIIELWEVRKWKALKSKI